MGQDAMGAAPEGHMGVREMQRARLQMRGPPGAKFVLHVSERIEGDLMGGMTYHVVTLPRIYLPLIIKNH